MEEIEVKNKRIFNEAYKRCRDRIKYYDRDIRKSTFKNDLFHLFGKENGWIVEYLMLLAENKTPLMMQDLSSKLRLTYGQFLRTEEGKTISLTRATKELKMSKRMIRILMYTGILRGYYSNKRTYVFLHDVAALKKIKEHDYKDMPDFFEQEMRWIFKRHALEVK